METESKSETGSLLSAIFLIAGTCIGGGMLALPVATGISGFLPTSVMMLLTWFAMTMSALFLLEVSLWLKEGAHIITMSSVILGPVGKFVCWCLYLFIAYASLTAYAAGGGVLMSEGSQALFGMKLSQEMGCLIFILVFGGIVYLGSRILGRVNAALFIAMVVAYLALVTAGISEVNTELLWHKKWESSFLAIPLLLTSFSFQTMLPSLTPYLKRNVKALRWAIVGGTTLTLIVYLLWEWMTLGIVPVKGPNSLLEALEVGEPITQYLRDHIQNPWISVIAEFFAFFALVTSFFGIALGLVDFLADGLSLKKTGKDHIILALLIGIPIFIFGAYFERVFMVALDISGGLGDSILNGIIPVLMVWVGRYYLHFPDENRFPGGKPLLIIVLLFFVVSLVLELLVLSGNICTLSDYCKVMRLSEGLH